MFSDGSDQADYLVAEKAVQLIRERKEAGKPFFMGVGFSAHTTPWWHRKSFSTCTHWKRCRSLPSLRATSMTFRVPAYGINGGDLLNKSEKDAEECGRLTMPRSPSWTNNSESAR